MDRARCLEKNLVSRHVPLRGPSTWGVIAAPPRVQCFQETIWRLCHLDTVGHASKVCCRCCQSTQLAVGSHSSEHWVSLHKSTNGWKKREPQPATSQEVKNSADASKSFWGESRFRALWQTASVWAVFIAFLVFTNSRDTTKNSLCLATTTRQKTIRQIRRERSTEREIREKQASASRIQIPPVKLCWAAVSPQCLSRHS